MSVIRCASALLVTPYRLRIVNNWPTIHKQQWTLPAYTATSLELSRRDSGANSETSDIHLECGDLSPLCFSNRAFCCQSAWRNSKKFPFQFQVKSAVQTYVVSSAKFPEKESGDESPHSNGPDSRVVNCEVFYIGSLKFISGSELERQSTPVQRSSGYRRTRSAGSRFGVLSAGRIDSQDLS